MDTLSFTEKKEVTKFVAAYNKARFNEEQSFLFQDREIVTDYAYYCIQYLVMEKWLEGRFSDLKLFTITKINL